MEGLDGTKTKKKVLKANLTPSAKKRKNMKKADVVSVKVEGQGTFVATAKSKKGRKKIKVGSATFYGAKKTGSSTTTTSAKKKNASKKRKVGATILEGKNYRFVNDF